MQPANLERGPGANPVGPGLLVAVCVWMMPSRSEFQMLTEQWHGKSEFILSPSPRGRLDHGLAHLHSFLQCTEVSSITPRRRRWSHIWRGPSPTCGPSSRRFSALSSRPPAFLGELLALTRPQAFELRWFLHHPLGTFLGACLLLSISCDSSHLLQQRDTSHRLTWQPLRSWLRPTVQLASRPGEAMNPALYRDRTNRGPWRPGLCARCH